MQACRCPAGVSVCAAPVGAYAPALFLLAVWVCVFIRLHGCVSLYTRLCVGHWTVQEREGSLRIHSSWDRVKCQRTDSAVFPT